MYVGLVRCLAGNWWLTLSNTNLKENRVFLYKFSAPDTGGVHKSMKRAFREEPLLQALYKLISLYRAGHF